MTNREWYEMLPMDIVEMRGDPHVLDMSPAARSGFVWLLMAQWIAEDGYLPTDEEFLRKASGLREAWAAAKGEILPRLTVIDQGYGYAPLHERWRKRLEAHHAMSAGAVQAANVRFQRLPEAGSQEGATRVAAGGPEGGSESLYQQNDVCVVSDDKAKGSVMRALATAENESAQSSPRLSEIMQYSSKAQAAMEREALEQMEPVASPQSPPNSREDSHRPRHEKKSGEGISNRPARVPFGSLGEFTAQTGMRVPEGVTGVQIAASPTYPGGPMTLLVEYGAQDEKQGAEVRLEYHGERLGDATGPQGAVLGTLEPVIEDDDEIEAMRANAMRESGRALGRRVNRPSAATARVAKW